MVSDIPESRSEAAKNYFTQGYNCSQAVVLAFSDLFPKESEALLCAAAAFGGGMGRLREVCGSVSGMFIVLGRLEGYSTPETGNAKRRLYADIQELARRFEAETGSIVCRELLGLSAKSDSPVPEARTADYYKKRPCAGLCALSAKILEEFLAEKGFL